jgi:hypothetical protein
LETDGADAFLARFNLVLAGRLLEWNYGMRTPPAPSPPLGEAVTPHVLNSAQPLEGLGSPDSRGLLLAAARAHSRTPHQRTYGEMSPSYRASPTSVLSLPQSPLQPKRLFSDHGSDGEALPGQDHDGIGCCRPQAQGRARLRARDPVLDLPSDEEFEKAMVNW